MEKKNVRNPFSKPATTETAERPVVKTGVRAGSTKPKRNWPPHIEAPIN